MTVGKDMAPVSQNVVDLILKEVVYKMTCNGQNMYQMVLLDKEKEMEDNEIPNYLYGIIISSIITFLIVSFILGIIAYRRVQTDRLLKKRDWEIPIEDILFYTTTKSASTGKSRWVIPLYIKAGREFMGVYFLSEDMPKI